MILLLSLCFLVPPHSVRAAALVETALPRELSEPGLPAESAPLAPLSLDEPALSQDGIGYQTVDLDGLGSPMLGLPSAAPAEPAAALSADRERGKRGKGRAAAEIEETLGAMSAGAKDARDLGKAAGASRKFFDRSGASRRGREPEVEIVVEVPEEMPVDRPAAPRGAFPNRTFFVGGEEVLFPRVKHVFKTDNRSSISALEETKRGANGGYVLMGTLVKRDGELQEPFGTGSLARILSLRKSKNGRSASATLQVVATATIDKFLTDKKSRLVALPSYPPQARDHALEEKLMKRGQATLAKLADINEEREEPVEEALIEFGTGVEDPEVFANMLSQKLPFTHSLKQELLAKPTIAERLKLLGEVLDSWEVEGRRAAQAKTAEEEEERKTGLRSRIAALRKELGEDAGPEKARSRIEESGMSPEAKAVALRTVAGEDLDSESAYLRLLTDLPWKKVSEERGDLAEARKILDEDHLGLKKVKNRIIEYLAVRNDNLKAPILCFVGPPGVAKTTLARAIAKATGRDYVKVALGGVHDEGGIRGRDRSYKSPAPGRILDGMRRAGTRNPVMLLDEIDKMQASQNGDPAAALLEVLDPEQNAAFMDHYLSVPYDLSKVMFIATANSVEAIPSALKDRLEIIEFPGYTPLEKADIAEKHLIPKQLKAHGLASDQVSLTRETILRYVYDWTNESGIRNLERGIATIFRKVAAWMKEKNEPPPGVVPPESLEKYHGIPPFAAEETAENEKGRVRGLAVTGTGGVTLNVEIVSFPGKGRVRLLKQLERATSDSAKNAYAFVRANAAALGIEESVFKDRDIHVAFAPDDIIDGPSAGTAMMTGIVSELTGRKVVASVAMTGEITPKGRVLMIGGLREKVLAADRKGVKLVLFPEGNKKDLPDIPEEVRQRVQLIPVKTAFDVLKYALERPR